MPCAPATTTSPSGAARGSACAGALPAAALAGLSGIMVIGFGDTMASVVGRTYGRVPIHAGSRKTVEGTLAGALSTMAAWLLVLQAAVGGSARTAAQGGVGWPAPAQWRSLAAATAGACLLEACTSQLDNILIPLWYLPHCLLASLAGG